MFRSSSSGDSSTESWSPPRSVLEGIFGEDDLIVDMIHIFKTDIPARIQRIRAALEGCEYDAIRTEAHSIKGSARQIGADGIADTCQELETLAKLQDPPVIAERLN